MNYLVESIILLCLCLVSPFRAHTHFLSCTHSHTQRDTHNAHILFLKFMKSQKQWSIIINLNLSSQREHIKDTIPSVKHDWFEIDYLYRWYWRVGVRHTADINDILSSGLGRAVNMADGWETARRLDRPKHLKVSLSCTHAHTHLVSPAFLDVWEEKMSLRSQKGFTSTFFLLF